jgi:hypothetical protein
MKYNNNNNTVIICKNNPFSTFLPVLSAFGCSSFCQAFVNLDNTVFTSLDFAAFTE